MQKQSVSGKASAMKMAELIVLFKPLVIGFLLAEVWSIAFNIGSLYAPNLARLDPGVRLSGIALVFSYARITSTDAKDTKLQLELLKVSESIFWRRLAWEYWPTLKHIRYLSAFIFSCLQ